MMSNIIKSKLPYDAPDENSNLAKELLAAFRKHGQRTLMVSSIDDTSYTGDSLLDKCGRIAISLRKRLGLKVDDVIMTMCDHTDRESLVLIGGLIAGQCIFGTWTSSPEELQVLSELSKPKAYATSGQLYEKALNLRKIVPAAAEARIILVNKPGEKPPQGWQADAVDHLTLDELINESEFDSQYLDEIVKEIDPKVHTCLRMMTSGTTGRPKMVVWTHEKSMHDIFSLISANKYSICDSRASAPTNGAKKNGIGGLHWGPLLPLTSDDVLAGDLPIDQGAGVVSLIWSLLNGSSFIIMDAFDEDIYWKTVAKYRITASLASATFAYKLFRRLKALIDNEQTDQLDLSCFRFISCVGAKLAFIDLVREVQKVYTHIRMGQFYGANEIGFISMVPVEESEQHLNSIGYLVPDIHAKVVDPETGKCLGPNQRGELHLWSHSLFSRYVLYESENESKVLADAFAPDGFYRTNDLVHYDEQERFYIHGRMRETLTLMNDWKMLPVDFEEIIDEHPLVESSVVVGIPDEDLPGTDAPRAYIKLISPGSDKFNQIQGTDLAAKLLANDHDYICKHIYDYKARLCGPQRRLKGGVRILEKFPTVGHLEKIDRKALKALA